jgi:hypothetical protein
MPFSLRTKILAIPVLCGVFLGFEATPAQAQYMGSPYGMPGGYNSGYGYGAPGYVPYNSGYYSGGYRSWAPRFGFGRFGLRRSWGPRYYPVPYSAGVPSI